jgi:predicted lipid carrier protein YhbT
LLAGLAMRPLPPVLLQPFLNLAMDVMRRRHGSLFERLAGLDQAVFVIDPVDLPFVFDLRPGLERPRLTARNRTALMEATASIRGPLLTLIELLEGRIDGDALFFSRDLKVEGDTEAVVALRNAVDSVEIDLMTDLSSLFGPLASPVRQVLGGGATIFARFARDLETLRDALIAPALQRGDALAAELRDIKPRTTARPDTRRPAERMGS